MILEARLPIIKSTKRDPSVSIYLRIGMLLLLDSLFWEAVMTLEESFFLKMEIPEDKEAAEEVGAEGVGAEWIAGRLDGSVELTLASVESDVEVLNLTPVGWEVGSECSGGIGSPVVFVDRAVRIDNQM